VEERKWRNPVQYEIETGAASRAVEVAKNPVLWTRCGTSADLRPLLLRKAQLYFDLSGVPLEVARAFVVFHYTAVIHACLRYFEETGRPLNVVIILEEAGALALVTPVLLWALQTLRKAGVYVSIVSQTIEDFPPDVFEQLMGLTDARHYYRMNSGVDRAAKDLADPTWREREVYATRTHQERDGDDVVQTLTETVYIDEKGKKSKGVAVSERFVPRYRTVVEEIYLTPQLHEQRFRTELATNEVTHNTAQRHVRDRFGVRREKVQALGAPWPLGLSAKRIAEAIARCQARPEFQQPQVTNVPAAPPPPPSAEVPASAPTPKGGRGMRKSSNS
jgi:hypothetical protein